MVATTVPVDGIFSLKNNDPWPANLVATDVLVGSALTDIKSIDMVVVPDTHNYIASVTR
jgi:hypothetical protein